MDHKAFYRPNTVVNSFLDFLTKHSSPKNYISKENIERWQKESERVYSKIGFSENVLKSVIINSEWHIVEKSLPPKNTWFGECMFCKKETPIVNLYNNSLNSRFPRWFFELSGQAGMDHIFGHLYPFHNDEHDFGEEVACRNQYRAAAVRGGIKWKIISFLIPFIYLIHKKIPIKNFY